MTNVLTRFNNCHVPARSLDWFDTLFEPLRTEQRTFRADVQEVDDKFIITAELPGVRKEDLNISMENQTVTIEFKQNNQHESGGKFHIRERYSSSMTRSFVLPRIDQERIHAELGDGILTVTAYKKEKNKIEIKLV